MQHDEGDGRALSNGAVVSHPPPLRRAISSSQIMPSPFRTAAGIQAGQIFAKRSVHSPAVRIHLISDAPRCRDRYQIEQSPFPEEKPNARFAIDMSTEKRVFLKFCPDSLTEFENAIRMHRILNESPHVCKLGRPFPREHRQAVPQVVGQCQGTWLPAMPRIRERRLHPCRATRQRSAVYDPPTGRSSFGTPYGALVRGQASFVL